MEVMLSCARYMKCMPDKTTRDLCKNWGSEVASVPYFSCFGQNIGPSLILFDLPILKACFPALERGNARQRDDSRKMRR